MRALDWAQLAVFVGLLALITPWVGRYLIQVLDPQGRTWLDPFLGPLERWTYAVLGVDRGAEQSWRGYAASLLVFSAMGCVFTYGLLRLQGRLPLNPEGWGALSPDLAFNTAVSFATNTNWQSYGGEGTMSYLSQMVGLVFHNFVSAAAGIGVSAAVVRGLSRRESRTLGSFWVDLVRVTYYLLVPASVVLAVFLVSQGMIQNFDGSTRVRRVDPAPLSGAGVETAVMEEQRVAQGPMASQVAIKMLGTNGGGFMNANAAHPFENPTPLSNFVQMLAIFAIGSGLTWYFGRATGNAGHGWSVWGVMMILFVAGVWACGSAERAGNPIHQEAGVAIGDGNMEGKEVRFGTFGSAMFATVTTAASCGAVNAMHDSLTPLGGGVPLFNIQLGEVIVGGVGAGLYGMVVFVVIAVFLAGLMVGRTPEYLGKKIGAYEVKMAMLALMVVSGSILGFSAWAAVSDWGRGSLGNTGPHGLSEILYAYSSAAGNNGSAFAGLGTNTVRYNTTLGLVMLAGRFLMIVPVLGMAGSLGARRVTAAGVGTFPVSGPTFLLLLLGTVVLVGALTFVPAIVLGPIVEHFLMAEGTLH